LAYYGSNFVAVRVENSFNISKGLIFISKDGKKWSNIESNFPALSAVAYGNNLFIAVGYYGTLINSKDGIKWNKE